MDHGDIAVVYRVSPLERLILGTLVPAGLCAIGFTILVLTGTWLFPLAYGLAGVAVYGLIRRARVEVGPAGLTRVLLRRRFIPWDDVVEVIGGYHSGGDAGQVRLRSGKLLRLRPLEADRGSEDYDTAVRVIHAVHVRAAQSAAVGLEHPLDIAPPVRRRRLVDA